MGCVLKKVLYTNPCLEAVGQHITQRIIEASIFGEQGSSSPPIAALLSTLLCAHLVFVSLTYSLSQHPPSNSLTSICFKPIYLYFYFLVLLFLSMYILISVSIYLSLENTLHLYVCLHTWELFLM